MIRKILLASFALFALIAACFLIKGQRLSAG